MIVDLTFIPPVEVERGDAIIPSLDGERVAVYRPREGGGGWTLIAQYERVGDVMISVGTL